MRHGLASTCLALALAACGGGELGPEGFGELAYTTWPELLEGHWIRSAVAGCEAVEEWWSFELPDRLQLARLDRDGCGGEPRMEESGSYTATTGGLLELTSGAWPGVDSGFARFTLSVLEDGELPVEPGRLPIGARPGRLVLNRMAYRTVDDGRTWLRRDWRSEWRPEPGGEYADVRLLAWIRFEHPPSASDVSVGMQARLRLYDDAGTDARALVADLDLEARVEVVPLGPALQLVTYIRGLDDPYAAWADYLEAQAAEQGLGLRSLEHLEALFPPRFWLLPGRPDGLMHASDEAWYFQMHNRPI
ncbi:MAG: hypothetical protein JXR96_25290 [Deltaproteobacteria bacterium]|nr:hypothetical protein [Deltaproteobacteria bacterium]